MPEMPDLTAVPVGVSLAHTVSLGLAGHLAQYVGPNELLLTFYCHLLLPVLSVCVPRISTCCAVHVHHLRVCLQVLANVLANLRQVEAVQLQRVAR